jgi:hypothetical protein
MGVLGEGDSVCGSRFVSIPEILELHGHGEIVCPHCADHRLQIIAALASDSHLAVLDLRGDFKFSIADKSRDLFGDVRCDALLDLDDLSRVAERRNVRVALLDILHADVALGEFA